MNSPHTSARARKSVRSTRLALQTLEDRCTPATAVYAAATKTLTVNAAEGDSIVVGQIALQPTGFIHVSDGSTVFDSLASSKPVRNLIVHFDGVNNGGLTLLARMRLPGQVGVFGAKKLQSLASSAEIDGNVTYTASAGATNTLTFFSSTLVGGNMRLNLRAGQNTVSLRGGEIGGKLVVTGTTGADRIELTEDSDLSIGGSASFVLGNGHNEVVGVGKHEFATGQSLTFRGGSDDDVFDMGSTINGDSLTTLRIGGSFVAGLGAALPHIMGEPGNQVHLNLANIGGNLETSAGQGNDLVTLRDLKLGGDFRASMGLGDNFLLLNVGSPSPIEDSVIGGSLQYTGGGFNEDVIIFATRVNKNVSINVVNSLPTNIDTFLAHVELGHAGLPLTVHGSLSIASGDGDDAVILANVSVDNSFSLDTGSHDDGIQIDDLSVADQTSINLGAGADHLGLETQLGTMSDPLNGISSFGGKFKIFGGAGDDQVNLSDDLDATTRAQFGGEVSLTGGSGSDTLKDAGNVFSVTGNFEDFELGASLP